MRPYRPRPIDTSKVTLPPELVTVRELLARHAHDVWASGRLADGWTRGPSRSDPVREHPMLVPYEELPQEEKDYDRRVAEETLKAIVALGFAIVPGAPVMAASADSNPIDPAAVLDATTLSQLFGAWRLLTAGHYPVESYRGVAEKLLKAGEPLVAYDTCQAGLARFASDRRLRQLMALALVNSGALDPARQILELLIAEDGGDAETFGLLGRTAKTRAFRARGSARGALLRESHEHYARGLVLARRASESDGCIYTAINAAATAALAGAGRKARRLARVVEELCAHRSSGSDYWSDVSRAEAALICREYARAAALYRAAVTRHRPAPADLSTTRRQARLLLEAAGRTRGELDACFPVPLVAILQPGHGSDRPAGDVSPIARSPAIVYCVLRTGRDVASIEALLEAGHEVRVIVSTDRRGLVDEAKDALARCTAVIDVQGSGSRASAAAMRFAELLQAGFARLRAQSLDNELMVATLHGDAWRLTPRRASAASVAVPAARRPRGLSLRQEIVALLFADAVNFSKLADDQVPLFFEHFVGLIAELSESPHRRPLAANTWGDGFYFVFDNVRTAGVFALSLCRAISRTSWTSRRLPPDLTLRIALHAGPTFACVDPITRRLNYIGEHVSRAARIEPITPPGRVYASEAFAALAAVAGVAEFRCEYVGVRPLPKNAGTAATYHVIPRSGN